MTVFPEEGQGIEEKVEARDAEALAQDSESPKPAAPKQVVIEQGERLIAHGVGRRKTASARMSIKPGTGKFLINGKEPKDHFQRQCLVDQVLRPFEITGTVNRFDVSGAVSGSGLSSQAGAVRLAIARALSAWQADFRPALSVEGLLTRDPRMVERKKYGIRGARRRPQWTKR